MAANTPENQGSNELVRIRKKLRLKQREMAEKLGLGFDQYRNYEYRQPPDEVLEMAKLMIAMEDGDLRPLKAKEGPKLRILGAVGAGPGPDYAHDDWEMPCPSKFARKEYAGLAVPPDANSMMPMIHPGDTLVFKVNPVPKLNKLVAVRMPGDTFPIVKKFIYKGGEFMLHSFNPEYPDIPIGQGETLGYLVGIIPLDETFTIGPEESGIDEAYVEAQFRSRLF